MRRGVGHAAGLTHGIRLDGEPGEGESNALARPLIVGWGAGWAVRPAGLDLDFKPPDR